MQNLVKKNELFKLLRYLYIKVTKKYMELKRNSNAVYLLNYHLILITKYRKQVFTNDTIVERTKEIMRKISTENDVEIINQECGLDHIHLMVSTKPTTNLTKYINLLKGHSSRALRKEFDLTDELYGDSFWSDSYYIATAGNVSVDTIYNYIDNQRKKI